MYEEKFENQEMDTEIEVYEDQYESEESGKGMLGRAALVLGGAVAAGLAAVWHFTKDKREEHNVKKLEKKGYIVTRPQPVEIVEVEEFSEEVDE